MARGARVLLHPEVLAYLEDSNMFVEEINPGNQLTETSSIYPAVAPIRRLGLLGGRHGLYLVPAGRRRNGGAVDVKRAADLYAQVRLARRVEVTATPSEARSGQRQRRR
jgi:hypothetical protein